MKTIDINKIAKFAVVDKEQGKYLGLVSTTALADDHTLFSAYTIGHGRGQCVLKKSLDRGETWSNRLSVPASWSTLLQVPTLFRIAKPDGAQRLLLITGHYPVRQSVSDDNGLSWTELEAIGEFGANVAMGSLVQLPRGRILAFFHDDGRYLTRENDLRYELHKLGEGSEAQVLFYRESYLHKPPNISHAEFTEKMRGKQSTEGEQKEMSLDPSTLNEGQSEPAMPPGCIYASAAGKKLPGMNGKIYMCISDDAGDNWTYPRLIAEHSNMFLGEPGAFISPDGKEISILMLEHNTKKQSYMITSKDEGRTWSSPAALHSALNGFRHTVRQLPDGRIMVVYGTRGDSFFPKDVVAWIGDYSSLKEGRDDFVLARIKENMGRDFGYSGAEVFPDGTCVVTTYGSWDYEVQRPYVVSATFDSRSLK